LVLWISGFARIRGNDLRATVLTRTAAATDHGQKPGVQVMFFEERVADLTRRMLRKKLYVLLSKPVVEPEKLKPFLLAHLEYMVGLEKRGLVFASGPLADGDSAGPPSGQGLTVLRAASAQEARALAERDPFFVNGLRTFELKEWTIMEGSLGLRVNLSDQTIEVS
jgi:uncharacterized protein